MSKALAIDGKAVRIVRIERHCEGYRVFTADPEALPLGPSAQHDVPQTHGTFRTNGHLYAWVNR